MTLVIVGGSDTVIVVEDVKGAHVHETMRDAESIASQQHKTVSFNLDGIPFEVNERASPQELAYNYWVRKTSPGTS